MSSVSKKNSGAGKKPSIGYEFDEIFNAVNEVNSQAESADAIKFRLIPLADITVGENVRKHFDEQALQELADSIESVGQQSPILVRKHPELDDKWIIVTGERRYRAMQRLGKTEIKAIIDDGEKIRAKQLVENIQRENMNILDIGIALHKFLDEEKLTQEEVASLIGKDRRFVARALSVTSLPEAIQELCVKNVIRDATATETLAKLFTANPNWKEWLVDEILAIVNAGNTSGDDESESGEAVASNICITRAIVNDLKKKLAKKQKTNTSDHEDDMPMTDGVPLTIMNASRLRRRKGYEKYRFNGANVRMSCVFRLPDEFGDKLIGADEKDPMKAPQLTTISTDNPDILVVEYQNQLFEVPKGFVLLTGMVPLSGRGKQKPKKE